MKGTSLLRLQIYNNYRKIVHTFPTEDTMETTGNPVGSTGAGWPRVWKLEPVDGGQESNRSRSMGLPNKLYRGLLTG